MEDFELETEQKEISSNVIGGALFALIAFVIIVVGLEKAVFLDIFALAAIITPQITGVGMVIVGTALFVFARWYFKGGWTYAFKRTFQALCLYVPIIGGACMILGACIILANDDSAVYGLVPFGLGLTMVTAYFGAKR